MKFKTLVTREAPIVKIEWVDSQSYGDGWRTFDSNAVVENVMVSIGLMIEEDAEKVSIVPHVGLGLDGTPLQMSGSMIIPRLQITTITILQEARTVQ